MTSAAKNRILSGVVRPSAPIRPGRSAGILLYRRVGSGDGALEVYLVHPGGPYFRDKDEGYWGIAKGLLENGEAAEIAARREFAEETGLTPPQDLFELGTVTNHRGKVIHGFAGEWTHSGNPPPVISNTCEVEWPRRSGTVITVPEVDEGHFFAMSAARRKINGCQREFLDRLTARLHGHGRG